MDIELLREKYRAEGFVQGVLAERVQAINSLGRIAAAKDIEGAVHEERDRLMKLQAKEAAAVCVAENAADGPRKVPAMPTGHGHTADHSDRVWASFVASKHGSPWTQQYESVFAAELARVTNTSEART